LFFAYRPPLIGRKLYGLMREAGCEEVRVHVPTGADTKDRMAPIVFNRVR
jgi:hypothetical protein